MPRLREEVPPLSSRAWTWIVSAAAGAALASFAGLLGRWSADSALGWAVALAAAGLGRAAASRAAAPDDDAARAWAAVGALAALLVPALLRLVGLTHADPSLLRDPLGGAANGAFVLGQAGLLGTVAAGAWSRASRGAGPGAAAAALAGAALALLAVRFTGPAFCLATAALAALAAAELSERPWARRETAPLRSRAFAAAAAAGLGLASLAPGLLPTVWMARLHAAYPGGSYLALADDGNRLWAAYRFSNGSAMMLRDGVPQSADPSTTRLALYAVLGQRETVNELLLVRPPEALIALAAQDDGAFVTISDGSAAEAAVLDALGGGRDWRRRLLSPPKPGGMNAALVFLPAPPGRALPGIAGRRALKALRSRLADGAAVGVLLPPGTPEGDVSAAARDASAVFGTARIADLPRGTLVLASRPPLMTDPAGLAANLRPNLTEDNPALPQILQEAVRWRPLPSAK